MRDSGKAGEKFTFPSRDKFLNLGNGFDWDNQWFVAPYPGTYFFSLSGCKSIIGNVKASIFVNLNGNHIGEALSSENTKYGAFSFQISKKLKKNDKIELFMNRRSSQVYLLYFTGWLVEQDLSI